MIRFNANRAAPNRTGAAQPAPQQVAAGATSLADRVQNALQADHVDAQERSALLGLLAQAENRRQLPLDQKRQVGALLGLQVGWDLAADRKTWTTGYWPFYDFRGDGKGDPRSNLWADNGACEKIDQLRAKRGLETGAKDWEKTPALNFLKGDGARSGYFIPQGTIREADAEQTTGVDFDGDGQLEAGAQVDFLADGRFGKDGQVDGEMDVSWWGSCDKVGAAGVLFQDPKRDVAVDGVRFTRQDIRGLLALVVDSQTGGVEFHGSRFNNLPDQVILKDGTTKRGRIGNLTLDQFRLGDSREEDGAITRIGVDQPINLRKADGTVETIPAEQIDQIVRDDPQEPAPALFHQTIKRWLRDEKVPFVMDRDNSEHVWNDNYDRAVITKSYDTAGIDTANLVGNKGAYAGGPLFVYEATLAKGDDARLRYRYWIEKNGAEAVNSGWLEDGQHNKNPDFLWRPKNTEAPFTGDNERNPFVSPDLVKEIYLKSVA